MPKDNPAAYLKGGKKKKSVREHMMQMKHEGRLKGK